MEDRERAGCHRHGARGAEVAYPAADREAAEDLTALSGSELSGRLEELVREERMVSRRRRALHAEIDVIRAELVRRGAAGAPAEELALALAGALSRGAGASP